MLLTTTPNIEGHKILEYKGIVLGETVIGANAWKDLKASLTNFFGGRSGAYEEAFVNARNEAEAELIESAKKLGANAVVGIDYDYETVGEGNAMMMVSISGTAVVAEGL